MGEDFWLGGASGLPGRHVHEHAKHLILDGIACAFGRRAAITTLDDAGTAALIGWDGHTTSAPAPVQ